MNDERLYAKVAEELQHHGANAGLWAKAYAESNGVESLAKAIYLRYRVAQLARAECQFLEAETAAIVEQNRRVADLEEAKRKIRAKVEGITPIHIVLLGLILFFVVTALIQGLRA